MDGQQILALGIVGIAAFTLGMRLWRSAKGEGCEGCGGNCGKPAKKNAAIRPAPEATPLVTLSMGKPKR